MKLGMVLAALPMILFACPAFAENWVDFATDDDGMTYSVDKDSIRLGSDGLVYYSTYDDDSGEINAAADCQKRLEYLIRGEGAEQDISDWRDHGIAVTAGSIGEAELQYVCANNG